MSESQLPIVIDLWPPPERVEKLTPQERQRETFRHRARQVLDDEIGWRKLRTKFREGKLSPQEFRELKEAGYHFDVEEKPVPPPVAIQIVNKFADGTEDSKTYVVTGDVK